MVTHELLSNERWRRENNSWNCLLHHFSCWSKYNPNVNNFQMLWEQINVNEQTDKQMMNGKPNICIDTADLINTPKQFKLFLKNNYILVWKLGLFVWIRFCLHQTDVPAWIIKAKSKYTRMYLINVHCFPKKQKTLEMTLGWTACMWLYMCFSPSKDTQRLTSQSHEY